MVEVNVYANFAHEEDSTPGNVLNDLEINGILVWLKYGWLTYGMIINFYF